MIQNEELSIQFLGAAETVTGSKHLLKTPEKNILIDCGLFQGIKSLRLKNWDRLPVEISTIDVVLITHAHLDHCGYLPLLIKNGFKGRIIMTPPTRDLVEIILRDSAKIQEEEAQKANDGGYSKHTPAKPLYTEKDVEKTLSHFFVFADEEWNQLSPQISFRFLKNGHILGSVFIELKCYGKTILFSGDIGRHGNYLLDDPTIIEQADVLVMESTYGDRIHPSTLAEEELKEIILNTFEKNGTVLIPSFAVERAQEIMFILNELIEQKKIPKVPIYLDSPMGADTTAVYLKYPKWHKLFSTQLLPISAHITIIREFKDTLQVMQDNNKKIIIAASGMLTGGRILNYVQSFGNNENNSLILVGFQAEGTRGRALKEGAKELKIYGKYVPISLQVVTIDSMSGHADQQEMLTWLKAFKKKPNQLFLVHGEPEAQNIFRVKIKDELDIDAIIPKLNEEFMLC